MPFLPSEVERTLDIQGQTLHTNLDQLDTDLKTTEEALKERTRGWNDLEDTARSFRQWMEKMDDRLSAAAELRQDLPGKVDQDALAKVKGIFGDGDGEGRRDEVGCENQPRQLENTCMHSTQLVLLEGEGGHEVGCENQPRRL